MGRTKLALLAALAIAVGCNALLGIESAVFDPSAAADAAADVAPDDVIPTPSVDAAAPDPEPPPPGACIDLDTNPRHCGACNHDCGPGACKAGVCQAGVVVTEIEMLAALVVTDRHVYYQTGSGDLRRAPIAGGVAATLYASGASAPFGLGSNLVALGDWLYFSDRSKQLVARCPLLGACAPQEVIGSFVVPTYLATLDGELYAGNGGPVPTVLRCREPSCDTIETIADTDQRLQELAVSSTDLVWSVYSDDRTPSIRMQPRDGGTTRTLYQEEAGIYSTRGLVIAGRSVYANVGGELRAFSLDTATATRLGRIGNAETLMLVDGELWYGFTGGAVYRRPLTTPADAGSVLVANTEAFVGDVVKHPTGVYWISRRRVMRLVL